MVIAVNSHSLIGFSDAYGDLLQRIDNSIAYPGMGVTEIRVVLALLVDETTSARVGRSLGIDSGQMSRLCERLEAKGYLDPRPQGARRKQLKLTPAGHAAAATILSRRRTVANEIWESFSIAERERFLAHAERFSKALDWIEATEPPRLARPSEVGLLVSAMVDSFSGERPFPYDANQLAPHLLRRFAELLEAGAEVYVAGLRGDIAGGSVLLIDSKERTAVIPFLFVFMGYQGRGNGYGRELLDFMVDRARKHRMKTVRCTMPASDHGRSYLSKIKGWERTSSSNQQCCGRKVKIEQWELDLTAR